MLINSSYNPSEVKSNIISGLKTYFDINSWQMNENIYIAEITDIIMSLPGVINVIDVVIVNIVGGGYSNISSSQATGQSTSTVGSSVVSTEMVPINNEIISSAKTILELRFPDVDIQISTVINV